MTTLATNERLQEIITQMIPGIQIDPVLDTSDDNKVFGYVTHPKRTLTSNSFANAAKRLGWGCYGTKSATNRNQFIILYVNVSTSESLTVKNTNHGMVVELWAKA